MYCLEGYIFDTLLSAFKEKSLEIKNLERNEQYANYTSILSLFVNAYCLSLVLGICPVLKPNEAEYLEF